MSCREILATLVLVAFSATPTHAGTLAGTVTAGSEGALEGVLVTAQKAGSTVSVTVVSDRRGRFAFPEGRLEAGHYALRIRALGYELAGPAQADVASGVSQVVLGLTKVNDIAKQMTSTEWFMSMPGTDADKRPLIECMSCHTLERVARSKYSTDEFVEVLKRMANYANNSTQARVQMRVAERDVHEDRMRKVANYLSGINLSKASQWPYELKTLPRPSGRATQVIITEWDLPRVTIAPHDVRTDEQGRIWYSNFTEPFLGRLDPKTGEHKEFAYPLLKPDFPTGSLDLEPDAQGNLWLALMFQAGIAKFDIKTETFHLYPVPPGLNSSTTQQSMVMPWHADVDGKVWTNEVFKQAIMRVDLASGAYEFIDPFKNAPKGPSHSPYGLAADAKNNLWFMDFGDENIGKVDAATGIATLYPTPTSGSRPRRVMFDGRKLWFAEFAANKLAMFDTERESFKEWPAPTPHSYPYDAFLDRTGDLWSGNMSNDRILRMNPETGASVEYLLPRSTNIRRIFVDNSTPRPTFWTGNNHGASIIRLEPLD